MSKSTLHEEFVGAAEGTAAEERRDQRQSAPSQSSSACEREASCASDGLRVSAAETERGSQASAVPPELKVPAVEDRGETPPTSDQKASYAPEDPVVIVEGPHGSSESKGGSVAKDFIAARAAARSSMQRNCADKMEPLFPTGRLFLVRKPIRGSYGPARLFSLVSSGTLGIDVVTNLELTDVALHVCA